MPRARQRDPRCGASLSSRRGPAGNGATGRAPEAGRGQRPDEDCWGESLASKTKVEGDASTEKTGDTMLSEMAEGEVPSSIMRMSLERNVEREYDEQELKRVARMVTRM